VRRDMVFSFRDTRAGTRAALEQTPSYGRGSMGTKAQMGAYRLAHPPARPGQAAAHQPYQAPGEAGQANAPSRQQHVDALQVCLSAHLFCDHAGRWDAG
jgi:hypothetical protein